ncbi:MAG: ThiF family adenylyltransferase [Acidobacteriales bacterium]|nr:ThiF family adenylyltransferase [Terriglobales bacterium]
MKPSAPQQVDDRYSRQILFAPVGQEGQQRLAASRVVIVGCGATGSALASLLARSGVGELSVIDRDYVEPSNLQRQSLFDEQDAAESIPKAIAAARKLAALNSAVKVESHVTDLTPENAQQLLSGTDLLLDGTDNFETRYLLNDHAVSTSTPWIYIAAVGSYAATMNIVPGVTACLTCVFPESPKGMIETCETAGILNSAVNLAASLAASEALKLLVGAREQLRASLLGWDVWTNQRSEVRATSPRPDCQTCGAKNFIHLTGAARPHITLCGRNSVQIHERQRTVDFSELSARLEPHGRVRHNEFVLKFWRDPYEMTLFPDGRAIFKGTTDTALARSLYARFVGS